MSRFTRTLTALAIVIGTSLACSGLGDMALDAALEQIENNPEARRDFENTVKEAVVQVCQEGASGKGKKKMEKVCTCAADKVIKDKSLKELFQWSQDFQSPAVQKEMMKVIKSCK